MPTLYIKGPVKDFPYSQLVKAAAEHRKAGRLVRAKFTCSHCGERVMGVQMEPTQTCPSCGGEHDFAASGGNYITLETL